MEKLPIFKSWVELEEAAKIISKSTGVVTNVEDLYQLALEWKLILSINLRDSIKAVLGKATFYFSQDPFSEMSLREKDQVHQFLEQQINDYGQVPEQNIKFIAFRKPTLPMIENELNKENDHRLFSLNQTTRIDGVWDLVINGAMINFIEGFFYRTVSINAPPFGRFFFQRKNVYANLVAIADMDYLQSENEIHTPYQGYHVPLEQPIHLVIRTTELQRFIDEATKKEETRLPFNSRERNNLLKLIAALMMVLKHKNGANMSQTDIIKFIHEQGYRDMEGLSQRQIEKVFGEANKIFSGENIT